MNDKSLKHRRKVKANRRVIKRRKIPEPICTCETEYIEPHHCPFSIEINDDYTECTCCPVCTDNCADNI